MSKETYLGDGLYCSFDGFQFKLRAPREGGNHEVFLEPVILAEFLRFVALHGFRFIPPPQPDLTPDDKEPF